MSRRTLTPSLRRALGIDAIASATMGLALCLFATALSAVLQLPAMFLFAVGAFCVLYAAMLARLLARSTVPDAALWTVIVGNGLWAALSAALPFTGWIEPNPLGTAFILAQAAIVFGFAELQFFALCRAPAVAALQQAPA